MKTVKFGRVRNKHGGRLEDLKQPITINFTSNGNPWVFISKVKELVSKDIFDRYSMLYLED